MRRVVFFSASQLFVGLDVQDTIRGTLDEENYLQPHEPRLEVGSKADLYLVHKGFEVAISYLLVTLD